MEKLTLPEEKEGEESLAKKVFNPEVMTTMNLWEKRRIEKAMNPSDLIKEQANLDFEKGLLRYFLGKEKAKDAIDFYDTNGPEGTIQKILSGFCIKEAEFIEAEILGINIVPKIEKYFIDKGQNEPYYLYMENFHPDVLFAYHIMPFLTEENHNFFVLKKSVLRPGDKAEILRKAEEILQKLEYSKEYYDRQNLNNPWEDLIKDIQLLIARTEPMLERPFIKTGEVDKWDDGDWEYGRPSGIMIKPPSQGVMPITLSNANKELFKKLKLNQLVRYCDKGCVGIGFPAGELVATELSIPLTDTVQLSQEAGKE